jgi:hypothetical protein
VTLAGYTPATAQSRAVEVALGTIAARKPKLAGRAVVGRPLKVTRQHFAPTPTRITYRWYRDGEAIPGATRATCRVTAKDAGHRLKATATATSRGYEDRSVSTPAVKARRR